MLDAIAEFATLFAVVLIVLLIVGWRQGWFLDMAVRDDRPKKQKAPKKRKQSVQRAKSKSAKAHDRLKERRAPAAAATKKMPRHEPVVEFDDEDDDVEDLPVHPAVAAASKKAGIKAAQVSLRDHWAVDTIKARPGWLMFELEDFLGAPPASVKYNIPGVRRQGTVWLYPIADVREIEKGDNIVGASRRKIILDRWQERQANRPAASDATAADTSAADTSAAPAPAEEGPTEPPSAEPAPAHPVGRAANDISATEAPAMDKDPASDDAVESEMREPFLRRLSRS